MEIYLIRHTTPAITKGLIYGRTDVPLAESFEEEKKAVLKQLPDCPDAVFSSPSARCFLLAKCIKNDVISDERLYELDFGMWEGKTWDSISEEESKAWMEDFVNVCPPEGENLVQMNDRVLAFWNHLKQQQYKKVFIVSHGGVIRLLLAALNNTPLAEIFNVQVNYGQVFGVKIKE